MVHLNKKQPNFVHILKRNRKLYKVMQENRIVTGSFKNIFSEKPQSLPVATHTERQVCSVNFFSDELLKQF